ncbi:unnamed protein product [Calypogeia fissa]
MAITKGRMIGGGFEGRCTVHRGTPQEKWRRTKDVTEDVAGNLKEAIKALQSENTSMEAIGSPPSLQATDSKKKVARKKALNKLGRALNQISTLEIYTTDLNEEMNTLQKRLEESERTQLELSERLKASTSSMHEKVEHYKSKMQETLDKLQSEESLMANMAKELEAARKEKWLLEEQLRGRGRPPGPDPEEHLKLAAHEVDLRAENEKLKKQITALKERELLDGSANVALKTAARAAENVERYKEVVAKVTADNMVFLMKLKRSEAALSLSQRKLGELQKEIESGRAQWLEEASSEIQEVIRNSLSKAETCEAKLQMLQRRQETIDEEWEEKLVVANDKLTQITTSRDWLEKNLIQATEKYKKLDDEKSKLLQKYESECLHRQHAEAESRAFMCTLRKTNEELAEVNLALGTSIKDTEAQRSCVLEKEKEINKILADLDKANCQLETQQAINTALMKKKEEVEWELMTVEAQKVRLHQNLNERPARISGKISPMANFL